MTARHLNSPRSLVLIMLSAGPITSATAASFDCGVASRPIEVMICKTPDLSQLDEALSSAYFRLRDQSTEADREQLKDEQRTWLAARNHCLDEQCVHDAIIARLKQLNASDANPAASTIGGAPAVVQGAKPRTHVTPVGPATISAAAPRLIAGDAAPMIQTSSNGLSLGAYIAAAAAVLGTIAIFARGRRRSRTGQSDSRTPPSPPPKPVADGDSPTTPSAMAPVPNSPLRAFCTHCGKDVRAEVRFCTNCGAAL